MKGPGYEVTIELVMVIKILSLTGVLDDHYKTLNVTVFPRESLSSPKSMSVT